MSEAKVTEMKMPAVAQVTRFGHTFKVVHRAGNTPSASDPQAALYVDTALLGYLAIGTPLGNWSEIFLDRPNGDESLMVTPEMLGMRPGTEDGADHRFLVEAEDYLLALLADELSVVHGAAPPGPAESLEMPLDPRNIHPRQRADRVMEIWHNHGKDESKLADLIAIEIFDAMEAMGMTLADSVDEETDVERDQCGDLIRGLVESTFQEWREDE